MKRSRRWRRTQTDPRVARRRVELLMSADRKEDAQKAMDEVLAKTPDSIDMLTVAASIDLESVASPRRKRVSITR
jgi:hypothetical protein